MERVRALANELRIHLVVGYAERRGDHMYNSVIIYSPEGEIVLRYSKTHTAGDDEPYNTKGTEFPVADQLVVALDLAQDPRGREILDSWEPDGRVW